MYLGTIDAKIDVHTKCCGTLSRIQYRISHTELTLVLAGGAVYSV